MKIKKALPLLALSLSIGGCSTLEKVLINSNMGKMAVFNVQHKYTINLHEECKLEDFGFINKKDESPEKPILLFVYGWASCLKEFTDEEKTEQSSKLGVMKEVFDNRIIMADYPSNKGIDDIFLGLEKSFLKFVGDYSKNNSGRKPKMVLAGHSMGTHITRLFARKYPEYIKKVGLIAGSNDGLDFGIFSPIIQNEFPKYMEKLLIDGHISPTAESYQNIIDMMHGSEFMKKLNTPTLPLDIEYNFYGFISREDNWLIPQEDDGTVPLKSVYPLDLIKRKKFEDVKIGEVIYFEGEVDHFSINNLDLLKTIMNSLKSERKYYSKEPPSNGRIPKIKVLERFPFEKRVKQYELNLINKIEDY